MSNQPFDLKKEFEVLAHSASHHLPDPLRQAQKLTELLRDNTSLTEDQLHMINQIDDCLIEVLDRVEIIRTYSHVIGAESDKEDIKVGDLVDGIMSKLKQRYNINDLEFEMETAPTICGSKSFIGIVFNAILDNAFRYRRHDVPLKITISCIHDDSSLIHFDITDNGQGFDMVYAEYIKTLFGQVDPDQGFGSGVYGAGLALASKIVERHGGDFMLKSAEGEGCQVSFTLPSTEKK